MSRSPAELLLARPGFLDRLVAALGERFELDDGQREELRARMLEKADRHPEELTPSKGPRAPSVETLVTVVAAQIAQDLAGPPAEIHEELGHLPTKPRLLLRLVDDGVPLARAGELLGISDPEDALRRARELVRAWEGPTDEDLDPAVGESRGDRE